MSFQVEEQRSSHSGSSNGQPPSIFSHPSGEYTPPTFNARLQSFSNYPLPHKVNILDLAKYGYIYKSSDETSQEVLCVGCKKVIKSWEVGEKPSSQQFHEEGCPFMRQSSTHSGSVTDVSETFTRASVSSHDEQTKPLETPNVPMSYEPHQVSSQSRKVVPRYRDAFSLPPEPTEYSEIATRLQPADRGRGRTTDVSQIDIVRKRQGSEHRSYSPSPSTISSYSGIQSYQPAFLTRSPDESLGLPQSFLPVSRHQDHQDLSRLENPPTLEELLVNLNLRDAQHRLFTFERYWLNENEFKNHRLLVICGFYCLGQGDAVECFCCHVIVANWTRNDNPRQRHIEMSPRCRFIKGEECGDISLALEVRTPRRLQSNLSSYTEATFPQNSPARSYHSTHSTHSLHSTASPHPSLGPIFQPSVEGRSSRSEHSLHSTASPHPSLGTIFQPSVEGRSTQSTHSHHSTASPHQSLGPIIQPSVAGRSSRSVHSHYSTPGHSLGPIVQPSVEGRSCRSEHSHHSSPGQSLGPISQPSVEGTGALNPEHQQEPYNHPTQAMRERSLLMDQFPCFNAANEGMREERVRLDSFNNNLEFRRNTNLRANNQQLAQSGLYYTGERDRTKCWLCDGGLENFLIEDDPWEEHAKFFPQCEYLLQQKGPAWVSSISARYPGIQRPIFPIRSTRFLPQVVSSPAPLPPAPSQLGVQPPQPFAPYQIRFGPPRPRIEDPQQMLAARERLLEQSMQTEPVQSARNMGFTDERIKQVQIQRIISTGNFYQTPNQLIQALINRNELPDSIPQPATQTFPQHIRIPGQTITIRSNRNGTTTSTTTSSYHGSIDGVPFGPNNPIPSSIHGPNGEHITIDDDTMRINGRTMEDIMNEAFGSGDGHVEERYTTTSTTYVPELPQFSFPRPASRSQPQQRAPRTSVRTASRSPSAIPMPPPPVENSLPITPNIAGELNPNLSTTAATETGTPEERLEAIERERRCKVCLSESADILFQPCGHICACATCAVRINQCPVCRAQIWHYVRTYHA